MRFLVRQILLRALLVLGFLCSSGGQANAAAGQQRIVISYDPSSAEQQRALNAVRAHVQGLAVVLILESNDGSEELANRLGQSGELALRHAALGTFSVEQGKNGALLVFFTEAGGEATLIRRLPPADGDQGLIIEQAAIVVRSLVEALLEGGRIAVTERPVESEAPISKPRTKPEPPASERERLEASEQEAPERAEIDDAKPASERSTENSARPTERSFFLSVGYCAAHLGSGLPWQSGLTAGARFWPWPSWYGGVHYTLTSAVRVPLEPAVIEVQRRPLELVVGRAAEGAFRPLGELFATFERTTRQTLQSQPGFEPTPERAHWVVGLGARAGLRLEPWSFTGLTLRAGADFLVVQSAYASSDQSLWEPSRIRARMDLDLDFGFW